MRFTKETFVTAFALFSLFFGAGNLILPPQLGFLSGPDWWLVALGFALSAVCIPVLGILAHARIQGGLFEFASKVSPLFSLVYCILIYAISVALPSPRTAAVTHEMAIEPLFNSPPLLTSLVYFSLVFIFVINRSKLLDLIGKWLTPAILVILVMVIGISLYDFPFHFGGNGFQSPFSHGVLEGYQTFDAIGAVVVGGVIIVSINLQKKERTYELKKQLIGSSGFLAGLALLSIYTGLILSGALLHESFPADISRTELLTGISRLTLGKTANVFLSLLVSLACFTTAVGIVTGASDFVRSRFPGHPRSYLYTAIAGSLLGIIVGQLNVGIIIDLALPALMFIYPVTIVLILLNVAPERYSSTLVFRTVIITTILFSIPDFINSLGISEISERSASWIPLSDYSLGWVIPALVVFMGTNMIYSRKGRNQSGG
ncbi:branched-chain amino acid transport system II carrier protein [Zeaxanthinibacter enoshimensis]|uniref:LIVCS family branched-chain amino acid:cation transporter n=1 Tax=Zeaxanthinibacter enoshimensis TaxID=392009 RepID=A0A4R6TS53_9FLAO|nr:branched-chain amino acid transport system II carrier protein [Zeaxanthinibacter enoshimensis]TDQ32709.1 LIVCS family branched-chain amino acid:cation transporter [Zeaxanthinibacter enoshimensis]